MKKEKTQARKVVICSAKKVNTRLRMELSTKDSGLADSVMVLVSRNGPTALATKVNGATIRRTAAVFSTTSTAMSLTANGATTRRMDMAPTTT